MITIQAIMKSDTPVLVVEINPHRQSSSAWAGAVTVGEVINIVDQTTRQRPAHPIHFMLKNNKKDFSDFIDDDGDFDGEALNAWEKEQSLEAHFEAAIDCAAFDGHLINVYWTKADALYNGTPRYMSDEDYAEAVKLVFE